MAYKSRAKRMGEALKCAYVAKEEIERLFSEYEDKTSDLEEDSIPEELKELYVTDINNQIGNAQDGISDLEELRDELQNWLDSLPENLQQGSKADELNEAIDELDTGIYELENLNQINDISEAEDASQSIDDALNSFDNVSFPRMFG